MSQNSGAAKPDLVENPPPETGIAAAALADEARNSDSSDERSNLHARTNTEPEVPKRVLREDDNGKNTEAAVNAALDSAIEDVANLLNNQSPTDQSTNRTQAENSLKLEEPNEQPQPEAKASEAHTSSSSPEQSTKSNSNDMKPEEKVESVTNASGNTGDRDSRVPERKDSLQPSAEQSRHSAEMLTEDRKYKGASANHSGNPQDVVPSKPDVSTEERSAKLETNQAENQRVIHEKKQEQTQEPQEQEPQESKREKKKASRGKNKKAQQDGPSDDQDENDTAKESNIEKESAKTKKKNRRKSKQSRGNVDSAKPTVEDDPETAEIKERIKQFGNDIRLASSTGKPQTDTSDDSNPTQGPTSRRLSVDALEFVPSSAIGTTAQTAVAAPNGRSGSVSASPLPPSAIDAPEFVPTTSKPLLTRPKSVKDIINHFDRSVGDSDVSDDEPDTDLVIAEPNVAANSPERNAPESKAPESKASEHKPENSTSPEPNAPKHDADTESDMSVTKAGQKTKSESAQTKDNNPTPNNSQGSDSQQAKTELHERIKHFDTASQGSNPKANDQRPDGQAATTIDSTKDSTSANKLLKQVPSEEKLSGPTQSPIAPHESSSKKPALQERIKQFNTASQASMSKGSDHKPHDQPKPSGSGQRSNHHKPAASLGEIDLDVDEQEVLEAPSPSIALVKKPLTDQRSRPIPSQRNTGPESKPNDATANPSIPDSGSTKPLSSEFKDSIEKALSRTNSEQNKPKLPFASADSKASEAPAAEQPKRNNPEKAENNLPETKQEQSQQAKASIELNNEQSKGKTQEKSKEPEKNDAETEINAKSKQPAASKPEPPVQAQLSSSKQPDPLPAQKGSSKSCCVIV